MELNRIVNLLLFCSFLTAFTGCGDSGSPQAVEEPRDPMAYLSLSITAVDAAPGVGSRADDYGFEPPEYDNEKISTMRFIIVDKDGKVEHNISISQNPDIMTAKRLFKVKPNETKQVYLFANEASIPEDVINVFRNLEKGNPFPVDTYGSYTLSRTSDEPLFTADQLIPMTEVHEVEIGAPKYDANGDPDPYKATLFVTRAAVKLSFSLNVTDSYIKFDPSALSTVTFNEVGDVEYLFPCNTTYEPPKAPDATDRIITAYSVPANAATHSWSLSWSPVGDSNRSFSAGPVYMPETKYRNGAEPYTITLPVNGVVLSAPLPNLPSLPRNTHVRVNINLYGASMTCEVTVVPYTGIYLDPDFGIGDRE
ncbi:MAG: hypothetical protein NC421_06225 [Lachnospiraceae bacterium]|nr:hypothetical protein [Lachnospiraceae bacterium]